MIYHPEMYNTNPAKFGFGPTKDVEIIVVKNSNGETGIVKFLCDRKNLRMSEK